MASLDGTHSRCRYLVVLIRLLLLQPWLPEAGVGGEGAQGESALPSPSPAHSVGGLEDPGASLWKPPPAGAPGASGAPDSPVTAAPRLVAFTPGDSDSYKARAAPGTLAPAMATGTPLISSGDVSGPGPRGLGPCLRGEGPQGTAMFSWGVLSRSSPALEIWDDHSLRGLKGNRPALGVTLGVLRIVWL